MKLVTYLREHPDVRGDVDTFETRLRRRHGDDLGTIQRIEYTPATSPGHDATGNDSLDRIAETYFGEGSADYVEWDGERVSDYIEVTDRDGTTHRFPVSNSGSPRASDCD